MRIVLFADNYIGLKVIEYLKSNNENIVGIFVHPPNCQNYYSEIKEASGLAPEQIQSVGKEWSDELVRKLKSMNPDIILVVFWNYILQKKVFEIPNQGCVNFHMSFLPYNKGKKPNVWPIIDGTPAGISIHYIDEGIDSGAVISQQKIEVELTDTAKTLYEKMIDAFPNLFEETWPKLKTGSIEIKKSLEAGTFHLDKEFKELDQIDLEKKMYPLELINLLRARTYPPHPSAYFLKEGKKVYVRVRLEYGE